MKGYSTYSTSTSLRFKKHNRFDEAKRYEDKKKGFSDITVDVNNVAVLSR